MLFIYVQLDANNICVGVSNLAGEVISGNMIQIDNFDLSLLGLS